MSESCVEIRIEKEFPLFGEGDTLETRLKNVTLRGFKEVRIYGDAKFETLDLTSEDIMHRVHTPQPTVFRPHLNRVNSLAKLFAEKGIDIFKLNNAYDYIAVNDQGVETNWTMIPPILEHWVIPRHPKGGLDYTSLVGKELSDSLKAESLSFNSRVLEYPHTSPSFSFDLINDGSHRVHAGFERGGIRVLRIKNMTPGFPYYAVPQPYSTVHVLPELDANSPDLKLHIVETPGHKNLYRLFPSGGIKTGDVRPAKTWENIK